MVDDTGQTGLRSGGAANLTPRDKQCKPGVSQRSRGGRRHQACEDGSCVIWGLEGSVQCSVLLPTTCRSDVSRRTFSVARALTCRITAWKRLFLLTSSSLQGVSNTRGRHASDKQQQRQEERFVSLSQIRTVDCCSRSVGLSADRQRVFLLIHLSTSTKSRRQTFPSRSVEPQLVLLEVLAGGYGGDRSQVILLRTCGRDENTAPCSS